MISKLPIIMDIILIRIIRWRRYRLIRFSTKLSTIVISVQKIRKLRVAMVKYPYVLARKLKVGVLISWKSQVLNKIKV